MSIRKRFLQVLQLVEHFLRMKVKGHFLTIISVEECAFWIGFTARSGHILWDTTNHAQTLCSEGR